MKQLWHGCFAIEEKRSRAFDDTLKQTRSVFEENAHRIVQTCLTITASQDGVPLVSDRNLTQPEKAYNNAALAGLASTNRLRIIAC